MTEFPSGVKRRLPFRYTVPNRLENYKKKCHKNYYHHTLIIIHTNFMHYNYINQKWLYHKNNADILLWDSKETIYNLNKYKRIQICHR
jgi:hypothetical protein